MADTQEDAAVNSTNPASVSFTATYTLEKPGTERASVTFTAVVDTGWAAAVNPASIIVTNQREGTVTLIIVVPAATLPSPVGTATLTGRMTVAGIQCEEQITPITVNPLPYFDWLVGAIAPTRVNVNGGVGSFTLTLAAAASVPVSAVITYQGPDGVTFNGPATMTIPAPGNGPANVTATVRIQAPNLAGGAYQLNVLVAGSTAEGITHEGTFQALLNVTASPATAFSAPWIPIAALGAVAAAAFLWWRRR